MSFDTRCPKGKTQWDKSAPCMLRCQVVCRKSADWPGGVGPLATQIDEENKELRTSHLTPEHN